MNLSLTTQTKIGRLLACIFAVCLLSFSVSEAQVSSFPYSYDFENEGQGPTGCNPTHNMVQTGWTNVTGDDMDWTSDQGGTGSSSTGPDEDHTPGGSYYMYLETSCSAVRTANLETPTFDFTSAPSPQVSFWFHMYGNNMGSMFFEVSTNGGSTWSTLFTRTGQQHSSGAFSNWTQAVINASAYGGLSNVKFRFRGVSGTGFRSDMAIDDFLVENILPNNAGISALVNPVPGGAAGLQNIDVELTNFGNNTLNNVTIEWEINGTPQTSVIYNTPAIPAFGNNTVNLGNFNFPTGVTNIKAWTSLPNNVTDTDFGNDTLNAVFCTGYSGTYTAGTATSDFPTIMAAVQALENCGVGGPVTIQVQPGTYGQVTFSNPIPGASTTNKVTFDGQGTAFLNSATSPTVLFDGATFVTLTNFNITCTATTDSWGVFFENGASYNCVINNNIDMPWNAGIFDVGGIVFSGSRTSYWTTGDNGDRNLIEGNRITGGDRGISMVGDGGFSTFSVGNRIVNNTIVNVDDYGIYIDEQDSIILMGNRVDSIMNAFGDGVYCLDFMNFEFTGNTVTAPDWAFYISDGNSNTTPSGRSKFINNMILSQSDYGFYAFDFESVDFWNNTIKGEPAVYANDWDGQVSIRNNIFSSDGDYAFENFDATGVLNMDYNCFYVDPANTNFIRWSTNYPDLASWQAATLGYDANSVDNNPNFTSATDLHVRSPYIYDAGDNTLPVTDDVDGDPRPGFGSAAIDIGADEFLLPNDDAGVSALVNPTSPTTVGVKNMEFTIQNFGGNTINNVDLEWEVNGTPQTPYSHSTPINVGGGANVVAGTYNFTGGLATVKAWTTMPNGVNDPDNTNDTLWTYVCTGLSGTYTVGTPTSDFATIADAVQTLQDCGVSGPVTMQVQPGNYTGVQLELTQVIPGSNSTNRVTWDGGNLQAVLTHDATGSNGNATVRLNNTKYITIQNFTIISTGTSDAWGIHFSNGCEWVEIRDNSIQVTYNTSIFDVAGINASGSLTDDFSTGNNAERCIIDGNVITGGERAITMMGQSGSFAYDQGNQITNNTIFNTDDYGIYLDEQDSTMIIGNDISDLFSGFSRAIYINDAMGYDIIGNQIKGTDSGIYLFDCNSNTTVTRSVTIANNMINIDDAGFAGIYMFDAHSTNIYHNTVKGGPALYGNDLNNFVDIRNNIFMSAVDFLVENVDNSAIAGMDYNLYYNLDPANNTDIISYGFTPYTDLADWQANNTFGYGTNSVEGDPVFVSPTDFHVDGVLANDVGDNNANIATDIDGDTRPASGSANVDIGADEFTPPNNDAGVVNLVSPTLPITGGFSNVQVEVQNFAVLPLNSFMVEWEINGVPQTPVPYSGPTVPVQGSTTVTLANINFPVATTQLKFWTSMPNGVPDERTSNDTLEMQLCPGLQGVYTVGSPSSDFPAVQDALDALMSCGVVGPTELQFQIGTYMGPLVLTEIPGASMTNTVTFNGLDVDDAAYTHNGAGLNNAATIVLNGADHIIIKNFTIENTSAAAAFGVLMTNEANHNTILNNKIDMPYTAGVSNVVGVLTSNSLSSSTGGASEGNNANYCTIEGNEITGGTAGIILEGGVSDQENVGNSIINNNIHDTDDYGIYVDEQDSLTINGNRVDDILASTSDGIYCFDIHNYEISGNEVTSQDRGIHIQGGFGIGDRASNGKITNNMITGIGTAAEALYMSDVMTAQIYHNSVVGSPGVFLDDHGSMDLQNNIMATNSDYCFETFDPVSLTTMDYNMYYISGSFGNAVRFGTTTYATLANWQATGPAGYDANSISGNPLFTNGLHVSSSLPEDAGTAAGLVFPVNEDFDGDIRPMGTAPDIGADERVSYNNDLASIALVSPTTCGDTTVIVKIANTGSALQVNVPIEVNVTGAATATFNFTQAIFSPGVAFDINMGVLNTSTGGTYNFEIIVNLGTDQNPMNDTLNVSVTLPPSNINALTSVGDSLVCEGNIADLMVNSSVSGISVLWYDSLSGGNLLNIGDSYSTGPIMTDMTYYVQLQGCNSPRAMVDVMADTVGIAVDLGPDTASICAGTDFEIQPTVSLSSAENYMWSNGAMSTFITVNSAGTYSLEVTNASGCKGMDTIVVDAAPMPTMTNTATNPTCGGFNNGIIDLNVSGTAGPYDYMWSNGATTQDINGIGGGIYSVTISDNSSALACSYVQNIQLIEPSTLAANIAATTTSCNGNDGTVMLSVNGGTSGYSYNWSNGATTQDLSGLAGGPYTVTVTDANGCTATETGTVQAATPIVAAVDSIYDEILDIGGQIQLSVSGGSGNFQYAWSNGSTTQDVDSLTAGTYSVIIVDVNTGCQVQINGIIVEYKIPDMVNNIEAVSAFKLYPNPTNNLVFVDLQLSKEIDVQLEITDIAGKRLQSFAPRQTLEQNYEIDMSDYPAGVYLARFIVGGEVSTTKIVVSRN